MFFDNSNHLKTTCEEIFSKGSKSTEIWGAFAI